MLRINAAITGLLACFMLTLTGCSSSGDSQGVEGSVTFQGKPLAEGSIQFFSTGEHPVPYGGALIEKGKYKIPKEHGLQPGTYLVKISYREKVPNTQGGDEMNPFSSAERIPAKYNTDSKLTADVRTGEHEFNFNLD